MTADDPTQTAAGPKLWMGSDMAENPDVWTRRWSQEQLDDLIATASQIGSVDLVRLDAEAVAPASIRALAADVRRDLIDRHGFTLLRGLPVDELDHRTTAAAFTNRGVQPGSVVWATRMSPLFKGCSCGCRRIFTGPLTTPGDTAMPVNSPGFSCRGGGRRIRPRESMTAGK